MKKNKIALKLNINFAIALLSFSVIIGTVFLFLFKNYTVEIHKGEFDVTLSNKLIIQGIIV